MPPGLAPHNGPSARTCLGTCHVSCSLSPHVPPWRISHQPHVTGKNMEVQRGEVTCPRSHSGPWFGGWCGLGMWKMSSWRFWPHGHEEPELEAHQVSSQWACTASGRGAPLTHPQGQPARSVPPTSHVGSIPHSMWPLPGCDPTVTWASQAAPRADLPASVHPALVSGSGHRSCYLPGTAHHFPSQEASSFTAFLKLQGTDPSTIGG